jgi:uncharacterized protein YqeY
VKALRYLKSLLLENKTSKSPIAEQDVIIKYHKKLKDSLELYKGDQARLEEINSELAVVAEFMPTQLSEQEVKALIDEIIASLENPNMGAVMKELTPKIKGQFDGKLASQMVKASLS